MDGGVRGGGGREKAGFLVGVGTDKTRGYGRGKNYIYVKRGARMRRTELIIHPRLTDRSSSLADAESDINTSDHYQNFPLYLGGETHEHYGIPHGFSSRIALE
ncbi:YgaC family protein, partial [Salmonella enterica]|uniref:YgaC family protein n=1 Tax=Salmonella enterica TaxID=28901 RepID=UPI00398C7F38